MTEVITQELAYIHKHWLSQEAAVFTLMVDKHLASMPNVEHLFLTLKELQMRTNYEYVGYASASLAYRASHVNHLTIPNFHVMLSNTSSAVASAKSLTADMLLAPAGKILENF